MVVSEGKVRRIEVKKIKFGTDGWRDLIAEDFTFANVRLVAQAIASYLQESGLSTQGIIIGYDNRFLSEHFAAERPEGKPYTVLRTQSLYICGKAATVGSFPLLIVRPPDILPIRLP
jgi:hypothetical protein